MSNLLDNLSGLSFSGTSSNLWPLFSNNSGATNFSEAIGGNSDFAKMLVAQIQNNSLKMLGIFGGEPEKESSFNLAQSAGDMFSLAGFPGIQTEAQEGFGFLSSTPTDEESDSLFTDQMLAVMRMNQIKVFQGLVGKKVKAKTTEGEEITAVVESIAWERERFVCLVGGKKVLPESITEVLSE